MIDPRVYLVSYDISNRRRWRRVFKLLKRTGEHVQLSVFVCRLPPARMTRLQARLAGLINPAEDRLLVVELGTPAAAAERLRGTGTDRLLASAQAVVV
jgi:CRISPR-associated protein Cas2